jgi:hypothetical protein
VPQVIGRRLLFAEVSNNMTLISNAQPHGRPATAGLENSWLERLFYLSVACFWAYCVIAFVEPLEASRRDFHAFVTPLLAISVLLVACAATPRGSRIGLLARFLVIAGILYGGVAVLPLFPAFAVWFVMVVFGAASDVAPYLFFGGLLALMSTLPFLLYAVASPARSRGL